MAVAKWPARAARSSNVVSHVRISLSSAGPRPFHSDFTGRHFTLLATGQLAPTVKDVLHAADTKPHPQEDAHGERVVVGSFMYVVFRALLRNMRFLVRFLCNCLSLQPGHTLHGMMETAQLLVVFCSARPTQQL